MWISVTGKEAIRYDTITQPMINHHPNCKYTTRHGTQLSHSDSKLPLSVRLPFCAVLRVLVRLFVALPTAAQTLSVFAVPAPVCSQQKKQTINSSTITNMTCKEHIKSPFNMPIHTACLKQTYVRKKEIICEHPHSITQA